MLVRFGKGKEEYIYSAFIQCLVSKRSDMDHTVLPANYTMGIVILSLCLSVTRVLCDKTKEHTDEILTLHERVINLVRFNAPKG